MFYAGDSKHIGLNSVKYISKRTVNSLYIKHSLLNSLETYWQELQLTMALGQEVLFYPLNRNSKGGWPLILVSSSMLSEPMVLPSFLMDTGGCSCSMHYTCDQVWTKGEGWSQLFLHLLVEKQKLSQKQLLPSF